MEGIEEVFDTPPHFDKPMARTNTNAAVHKHLYFVRHLDTGAIKIGRSSKPDRRLAELRKVFGGRMALIGHVLDAGRDEVVLHANLANWALGKEWFSPSAEVLQTLLVCLTEGASNGVDFSHQFKEDGEQATPA